MINPGFETTFVMNNPGFETTFSEVNDDLFDDVMKYFDFPLEDVKGTDSGGSGEDVISLPLDGGGAGGEEWDFQKLEPPPVNVLAGLSSGFSGDFFGDGLVKCVTVSCDGSSQLNQQSSPSSTKASSSRSITLHSESSDVKGSIQFQTSSPVSVLESSSSCSAAKPSPINPTLGFLVKRSRSKRRRASTFNGQFTLPIISSTSSTSRGSNSLVGCESESESYLMEKLTKKRQKKKRNLTLLSSSSEIKKSPSQQSIVRKCMHCEVTKTPQWREGPMGPKTLCNACGVRYRSGRLLPEYRPAASPTFVPSLHSNSHKKVVEMRKKAKLPTTVTPSVLSIPPGMSFG